MRLIPILSRVPGFVDKIYADDYAIVKQGQLLMVVDSSELVLQLEEMRADFNQAVSDIDNAKAMLVNSEASVAFAKGNLEVNKLRQLKASNDLERDKNLFKGNAITK